MGAVLIQTNTMSMPLSGSTQTDPQQETFMEAIDTGQLPLHRSLANMSSIMWVKGKVQDVWVSVNFDYKFMDTLFLTFQISFSLCVFSKLVLLDLRKREN